MNEIPQVLRVRLDEEFVPQEAYQWRRSRWTKHFPDDEHLAGLPDMMCREDIAKIVDQKLRENNARDAFLTVQVWGTLGDNRGAWRTKEILTHRRNRGLEGATATLLKGARKAQTEEPDEAFSWMNNEGRLYQFGSSFFTKWLYFASAQEDPYGTSAAPILDQRVITWLHEEAGIRLRRDRTNSYQTYLEILKDWGQQRGLTMAQVETVIFSLTRKGS